MKAIEVEHLSKVFRIPHEKKDTFFALVTGLFKPGIYETLHALKDVSFSIEKGETFGVIGENGSGKSTLLKVIAGIFRPTGGTVKVHGIVTPFLELGIGFNWGFTAVENIYMYAAIMGLTKRETDEKVDSILQFAGLEKFRDTQVKHFSSGMYARLGFSTAIQTKPDILLLDEVLAVGDLEFQKKCLAVMRQFRNEGVTMVFVSHDLISIRNFCDRTLLLSHGNQVALGDTQAVIEQYTSRRSG
jgi:ABC-type polysaccharide/polyol phosphate transport system ATPase subunit